MEEKRQRELVPVAAVDMPSGISSDTGAVMGCAVNGPGEAKDADFGVACGDGCGLIFSGGVTVGKVGEDEIIDTLIYMCEHDGAVPSLK